MSKTTFVISIEHALQALNWADQMLDDADEVTHAREDTENIVPWLAAQSLVFEAMCLLIDTLDGVETVTYSSEKGRPVPKRIQPYSYLSARHAEIASRYRHHAHDLEYEHRISSSHE